MSAQRLTQSILSPLTTMLAEMGFDDERLATLARDSWTHSGAPEELKAEGIRQVDAWLAADPDADAGVGGDTDTASQARTTTTTTTTTTADGVTTTTTTVRVPPRSRGGLASFGGAQACSAAQRKSCVHRRRPHRSSVWPSAPRPRRAWNTGRAPQLACHERMPPAALWGGMWRNSISPRRFLRIRAIRVIKISL